MGTALSSSQDVLTDFDVNRDEEHPKKCTICGRIFYYSRVSHTTNSLGFNLWLWVFAAFWAGLVLGSTEPRPWAYFGVAFSVFPAIGWWISRWEHLRDLRREFPEVS